MFDILRIGRRLLALRDDFARGDMAAIAAVVKEVAGLLGLSAEAAEVTRVVNGAAAGNWYEVCDGVGDFLSLVALRLPGAPAVTFGAGVTAVSRVDALVDSLQREVADDAVPLVGSAPVGVSPAVWLAVQIALELAAWVRSRRG